MKAVTMMKKAIEDMRNEDKLNGWNWKANKEGLTWEYLNSKFNLSIEKLETGDTEVEFMDPDTECKVVTYELSEEDKRKHAWMCDGYHDFNMTIDEAIYWATRKMISKANYLY